MPQYVSDFRQYWKDSNGGTFIEIRSATIFSNSFQISSFAQIFWLHLSKSVTVSKYSCVPLRKFLSQKTVSLGKEMGATN